MTDNLSADAPARDAPGYSVKELLRRGSRVSLYRGLRDAAHAHGANGAREPQPVIIKMANRAHPPASDFSRLQHEHEIGQLIHSPFVLRPYALVSLDGHPALILEDFGGEPLDRLTGEPMPLPRFLSIAVQIAAALADIHRHGVVHKDIKPANVFCNARTGAVKIASSGIATLLPSEHQPAVAPPRIDREAPGAPRSIDREAPGAPRSIDREASGAPRSIDREAPGAPRSIDREAPGAPRSIDREAPGAPRSIDREAPGAPRSIDREAPGAPRSFEGTLAYLAPEQTGRMNRAVDQRTDLYSAGATFYQLLTGSLLFAARDPLSWIHCHIARIPPPPRELRPGLPQVVSDIVMKLLSKAAEERYQSARGLQLDLEECLRRLEVSGSIAPFPIAAQDASDRFQIPQRLYGRQQELAALLAAFERVVAAGSPELLLVSGYSGVGKSSLVHELHKPIARDRGFFISGKFDQYRRNIPYATIVEAFRVLVLDLLTESEERVALWRGALRAALGQSGQIITEVIPQVELIIGPQPPVPELPPAEAQNRFLMVFRRFVGAFASREHPLVLFLDDLQWADAASLRLLGHLLRQPEIHALLLIGAYRDNEVDASHPLMLTIDELRRGGAKVGDIVLSPLSVAHLCALVADTLRCDRAAAAPLAALVHQKTAGNPFFASQFLGMLHQEHLIAFDAPSGAWRWDVERIREKGFTDNVADLVTRKLLRLSPAAQEAVKLAACLGNSPSADALVCADDRPEEEIHRDLWEAVREGLLLRTGDGYRFLHDRVQQAAYSLIDDRERPAVHRRIGQRLLQRTPAALREERVFDIVNQLNRGVALITDPAERDALSRLNFLAGKRARASIAYGTARGYLAQATALLAADAWSARYAETLALYLERSECEYLCGNFTLADELFHLIPQRARGIVDQARAYNLRLRLYQVAGRYDEGVTVGLQALRLFGVILPESDEEIIAAVEVERAAVPVNLKGRRIADLIDAPVVTDPAIQALVSLLSDTQPCAYIGRPKLFPLLCLKTVNLSLLHGNTREACFAYSAYALMLVSVFADIPTAFEFSEMSIRLNERFGDIKLKGTLLHLHGDHVNYWCRPIATDFPYLERGFAACQEAGDLVYASYLAFETVWQAIERGDRIDEVLQLSQRYEAFARQVRNDPVLLTIRMEQQFLRCLKGQTRGAALDGADFDERECLALLTQASFGCGVVFYHIIKLILLYTWERYDEALAAAEAARPVLGAAMAMPIEATYYFYHALTVAALLLPARPDAPDAPRQTQRPGWALLAAHREKFDAWARLCPENFLPRRCLLAAEMARLAGRFEESARLYEEAIRASRASGFLHTEALAYELAGRAYGRWGFDTSAQAYLREAGERYARWGAEGKLRQLSARHRPLGPGALAGADLTSEGEGPTVTIAAPAQQLDLLAVVKASQTISGEIELERLIRTLIHVVIEQSRAQRGFLLMIDGGALRIRAHAEVVDERVQVDLLPAPPVSAALLPVSILNFAVRTGERVLLDDPAEEARFAADSYLVRSRPRSVLCLPIRRQASMVGLLYLENNLTTGAFTSDTFLVLELLAAQAAISLENALLYQQTQEQLRIRDDFLSIASHELATPVAAVQLAVQRLLRDARQAPGGPPRLLVLADQQSHRVTRLIDDLLNVTRIRAGKLELQRGEVDLSAVVREVAERHAPELERARCALSLTGDAPVIGLWDRARLEQVVTNLLGNALKYGAGRPIEISVASSEGRARLTIRDEGIGIPAERLPHIFERFERAASARHYGGLGLGLYIARQIVTAHGGSIRIQSTLGAGSIVTVELPRDQDAALAAP